MPKRPPNHELETASQRAFENALPDRFVVRPVGDDYGVDREVEVFEEGEATGLTFKVQLKATGGSGTMQRIKRDSLEYWHSLDVPVLLVSYEASSSKLRARWVHSIGTDGPDNGAATITVHMDPDLKLDENWANNLANDLTVIRGLRRGVVPDPIPIRVSMSAAGSSIDPSVLTAALLQASRRSERQMAAANEQDAALAFEVTNDRIRAVLPLKFASATLHMPGGVAAADPRALAENLLVLAAAALSALNPDVARELAYATDLSSPLWQTEVIAERLGPVLATTQSAEFLFGLVAHLDENGLEGGSIARDMYFSMLHDLIGDVSEEAFGEYSTNVRRALDEDDSGERWQNGRRLYNLGHLHKARRDHEGALELLRKAAEHDPRYATDPGYLRDLGATEWELEEYMGSAAHYQEALNRGYDPHELRPLLADSLMYAGHYKAARDALEEWVPVGEPSDKAGLIRQVMLAHIAAVVDLNEQDRGFEPEELKSAWEALQAEGGGWESPRAEGEIARRGVVELLRDYDALHPRLWLAMADPEDAEASFPALLIAAMMLEREPDVWLFALLFALAAEVDEAVIRAIMNQARFLCGDAFYDAVWDAAEAQEDENAELLRRLVSEIYTSEPTTFGTTFRWVNGPDAESWILDEMWIGGPGATPPTNPRDA